MEGTISEIRIFAGNFAPGNWALCQGQLLSIAEYTALYSLIGTTYGGDGQTTFAVPNYCGRIAVGTGTGPGLSNYVLGQMGGTENVTLLQQNLTPHAHPISGTLRVGAAATTNSPTNAAMGVPSNNDIYSETPGTKTLAAGVVTGQSTVAGSSMPVEIIQPYLALNVIICLEGIYPSRA